MNLDLTQTFQNNLKRFNHACVSTVKAELPRGVRLVGGEQYVIGVVPPKALILTATVVVEEAFNGTTPTAEIKLGGTVVRASLDLATVGVTNSAATARTYTGVSSTLVTFKPTASDSTEGVVRVVIEYIEVEATTGMYAAEQ